MLHQENFPSLYLTKFLKPNGDKLAQVPVDISCYGDCVLDENDRKVACRTFDSLISKTVTAELKSAAGKLYGRKQPMSSLELQQILSENNEVRA